MNNLNIIIDPTNNKQYSIKSKKGINILKKYILSYKNGGTNSTLQTEPKTALGKFANYAVKGATMYNGYEKLIKLKEQLEKKDLTSLLDIFDVNKSKDPSDPEIEEIEEMINQLINDYIITRQYYFDKEFDIEDLENLQKNYKNKFKKNVFNTLVRLQNLGHILTKIKEVLELVKVCMSVKQLMGLGITMVGEEFESVLPKLVSKVIEIGGTFGITYLLNRELIETIFRLIVKHKGIITEIIFELLRDERIRREKEGLVKIELTAEEKNIEEILKEKRREILINKKGISENSISEIIEQIPGSIEYRNYVIEYNAFKDAINQLDEYCKQSKIVTPGRVYGTNITCGNNCVEVKNECRYVSTHFPKIIDEQEVEQELSVSSLDQSWNDVKTWWANETRGWFYSSSHMNYLKATHNDQYVKLDKAYEAYRKSQLVETYIQHSKELIDTQKKLYYLNKYGNDNFTAIILSKCLQWTTKLLSYNKKELIEFFVTKDQFVFKIPNLGFTTAVQNVGNMVSLVGSKVTNLLPTYLANPLRQVGNKLSDTVSMPNIPEEITLVNKPGKKIRELLDKIYESIAKFSIRQMISASLILTDPTQITPTDAASILASKGINLIDKIPEIKPELKDKIKFGTNVAAMCAGIGYDQYTNGFNILKILKKIAVYSKYGNNALVDALFYLLLKARKSKGGIPYLDLVLVLINVDVQKPKLRDISIEIVTDLMTTVVGPIAITLNIGNAITNFIQFGDTTKIFAVFAAISIPQSIREIQSYKSLMKKRAETMFPEARRGKKDKRLPQPPTTTLMPPKPPQTQQGSGPETFNQCMQFELDAIEEENKELLENIRQVEEEYTTIEDIPQEEEDIL